MPKTMLNPTPKTTPMNDRKTSRKGALGLCLLGSLLLSQTALASAPVGPAVVVPTQAQAQAPGGEAKPEAKIDKLVQQAGDRCSSPMMARTRVVKRDCPAKMEAVARLGDRAVPALTQQVLAAATAQNYFDDRGSIMAELLGRIGTPTSIGALIDLLGNPAVVKSRSSIAYSVNFALLTATKAKVEGQPRDEASRLKLHQAWLKWRDDQQKPSA